MQLTRDLPRFRPVTIRLEKADELDQLLAVLATVADGRINHLPQVVAAAKRLSHELNQLLDEE